MKNVALIGAGHWGKNIARNLHELGVLKVICDTHTSHLVEHGKLFPDVEMRESYQEVLRDDSIKRVMLATPPFKHFEMAKQALDAGKDVFVEKPITMNSDDAEKLITLAREKGLILMVGHLLHYHPCVKKLQEVVAQGEIGKLQYITSNRLDLGRYRTEENALWNFAPHDISVILSLCGYQLPTQVRCIGSAYLSEGVADVTLTTLQFQGDLRAHIYVSWLNPFKEQKLTVVGSHGMVVFDDRAPWGEKLQLYRDHVTWEEGKVPVANRTDAECIDPAKEEPLRNECLHFIECCDKRIAPKTDGSEGLRVLQVLQAAQESLDRDGEAHTPLEPHHLSLDGKRAETFIHPTAVIDDNASIATGVQVWHFSHIMGETKIGEASKIGQNVFVGSRVTLGKNVKVQNNVSIYSGVTCEDDVFLGPSMVFTNIANPRSEFVRRDQYVPTLVKKGSTIGANATILCGITLGEYSFIGAGAVVTHDVQPYALVVGNPAKQTGWMSRFGHRLDLPLRNDSGKKLSALCAKTGEEYVLEGEKLLCS